jgi:hypothetical protein
MGHLMLELVVELDGKSDQHLRQQGRQGQARRRIQLWEIGRVCLVGHAIHNWGIRRFNPGRDMRESVASLKS